MSARPNVLLIGSGGVGTVVSYLLLHAGKSTVTSVIRLDFDHVTEHGYQLESHDYGLVACYRPDHFERTVAEAAQHGPFEFVVVCIKNIPEVQPVEKLVAPAITSTNDFKTTVVLIQNGFGIETPLIKAFPGHVVLGGIALIGTDIKNGKVTQHTQDKTGVGYFDNGVDSAEHQEAVAQRFISLYSTDKNSIYYTPDSKSARWFKLGYNATFNTVCALTMCDVGRVDLAGGTQLLIEPAMDEVMAIATADGVSVGDTWRHQLISASDGLWYRPSMMIDLEKGNMIEIEVVLGNALAIAERLGVATPILTTLYRLLRVVQFRLMETNGVLTLPEERPPRGAFETIQYR